VFRHQYSPVRHTLPHSVINSATRFRDIWSAGQYNNYHAKEKPSKCQNSENWV